MSFRKNWVAFILACPVLAVALVAHPPEACGQSEPAVALATPGSPAKAIVPRLIKFSGTLLDEQAQPMKSPAGVTFALYAQQSGSAALWMETQNVETDAKGNYTVLLGANSADGVPAELFTSGEARWLGVQAERQPEQPRVLLVSVPYALKAGDAQTLGGLPPSAFAPASSAAATSSSSSAPAPMLLASPGATSAATAPLTTTMPVTTAGGATNFIPLWGSGTPSTTLGNSLLFQSSASSVSVNGSLSLPAVNTATATVGSNSQPLDFLASSFNSAPAPGAAVTQHFRWQSEPVNNNTASPSGKLNLLFASGTLTPAETGLSISSKGLITFAAGQTIPTVSGNETVTGNLSAAQLVSTVATGTAPLSVKSTTLVPNLNANFLGGIPASAFATLGANTFAGTQAINGNLALAQTTGAAVGVVTMGTKSFIHSCCVGIATDNIFVGPGAGNFTLGLNAGANTALGARALAADTSGFGNTAIGSNALTSNTTGVQNVAVGIAALSGNSTGQVNTGVGLSALGNNTTGNTNAALGADALSLNSTGSNNTAVGFKAGVTSNAGNSNLSGSNNTFLGYQAGPGTVTQLANATAIGANALVSASNSLVLGGTGANAVKVGIGTATPAATLDVNGAANFSGPVTFAAGQTFPAATVTGNETVQGNVSASGQLISSVATGTAPLNVTSTTQVPNLNASLLGGLGPGAFAQLAAANTFTKTQTINANLGIGTTTPLGKLEIQGGADGTGANDPQAVALAYRLGGFRHWIRTRHSAALGSNNAIDFFVNNSTAAGGSTGPGNGSLQVMTLDSGKVGIGTMTPSSLLDVNGTVRAETGLSLGGNAPLSVDAPGLLGGRFTVQPNGFVGIGNPTPSYSLHVQGTMRAEHGLSLNGFGGLNVDFTAKNGGTIPGGIFTVQPEPSGMVGIGISNPSFLLHVNGTMRAETGLSLGGNAPLSVDAPGVIGGRFTVLPNGNVGINNPNPSAALDVTGSVRINGDTPMTSNPRMSFSSIFFGSLCQTYTECGGGDGKLFSGFVSDKNILITRMAINIWDQIDPSCAPAHVHVFTPGFQDIGSLPLPAGSTVLIDSGPISISIPAGTLIWVLPKLDSPGNCKVGASAGGNVFINVQYVMQ